MAQSGRRGVNGDKSRFGDEKDSDEDALAHEISSTVKALYVLQILKLECVIPKRALCAKQIDVRKQKNKITISNRSIEFTGDRNPY